MDLLVIAAVCGAIVGVFTFIGVTWKLMRFVFKVDRALPTLLSIAGQFESNGGSTLKDKIEKIHERSEELAVENRVAVKIAEDSRVIANTNASIVNELSRVQGEELTHIREYLHEKLHDVMGHITKTNLQASATEKRSARIEERLDKLLPYVVRHREDYTDNGGGDNAHN